jgi:Isocitrate/isopropylmalate dehydrogenase
VVDIAGDSQGLINIRPVHLFPGINIPLRDKKPTDIDFVYIRENTEGEYAGAGGRLHVSIQFQISPNLDPVSGSSCQSDDLLHLPHLYDATEAQKDCAAGCRMLTPFPLNFFEPPYLHTVRASPTDIDFHPMAGTVIE